MKTHRGIIRVDVVNFAFQHVYPLEKTPRCLLNSKMDEPHGLSRRFAEVKDLLSLPGIDPRTT
jgi:hypothetical protein